MKEQLRLWLDSRSDLICLTACATTWLASPFGLAFVSAPVLALMVPLRSPRAFRTVLFVLSAPTVISAMAVSRGLTDWTSGDAVRWERSMSATGRGNIDPTTRTFHEGSGCLTTVDDGIRDWLSNGVVNVLSEYIRPPRGAYTGPLVAVSEVSEVLKSTAQGVSPNVRITPVEASDDDEGTAPAWLPSLMAYQPHLGSFHGQPGYLVETTSWSAIVFLTYRYRLSVAQLDPSGPHVIRLESALMQKEHFTQLNQTLKNAVSEPPSSR